MSIYSALAETMRFSSGSSAKVSPSLKKRRRVDDYSVESRQVVNLSSGDISAHANWRPTGIWEGSFDIAVWLRMPQGCQHPLQLALRYTDQRGDVSIPVDIFKPSTFSCALLNGSIRLAVSGRIKNVGLYLVGSDEDLSANVEEWHITPQITRPVTA